MASHDNMITVRPEINEFHVRVDEYVSGLPILIREQMRQALYQEFEENYGQTEEICLDMIEKAPDHPDVWGLLGRARFSQGKYAEAVPALEKAVELAPDDNMSRISLGIGYHALGNYRKAIDQLEKVGADHEYHPFYYSTLGDCYLKTGKDKKARDAFRAEVTRYEETRQMESAQNLDGCFCNLIYLDGALSMFMELTVDLGVYKRFLERIEMTPLLQEKLAGNISYWSTLLPERRFRAPFVDFVREVENQGYLLDSSYYYIIENAYRSAESYAYHEDSKVDRFLESFLSAMGHVEQGSDEGAAATALSYQWYLTRCIEEYADELLYVAEQYPHSYARIVTFLDQLGTYGPDKTREMILDRLINGENVKVGRKELAEGLDQSYERARSVPKEPVYLSEGKMTYRRDKKILPNDPCPCGSGKKYKKCHGRI